MAILLASNPVAGQQASPPSSLADELCNCVGSIDPKGDDHLFELSVRHCLNNSMMNHPEEVVEIMRRFPAQDGKYFLFGLLLGGALDRTCPQYPMVKDRLRQLLQPAPGTGQSNT